METSAHSDDPHLVDRVGWLRAAVVSTYGGHNLSSNVSSLPALCELHAHAAAVPTAGNLSAHRVGENASRAIVRFEWATSNGAPPLLLTLPHHREQLLTDAPPPTAAWFHTHRGVLSPLACRAWPLALALDMHVPLDTRHGEWNASGSAAAGVDSGGLGLPWSYERPISDCTHKEEIFWSLQDETTFDPGPFRGSIYWAAKGWWRLSRLALLAAEVNDTQSEAYFLTVLRTRLSEALDSENGPLRQTHPFVYEPEWGGVMVNATMADFMIDFGAGWYNDHHFHYGYVLYCAAVLARTDRAWAARFGPIVRLLLRDIASPVADGLFSSFRSSARTTLANGPSPFDSPNPARLADEAALRASRPCGSFPILTPVPPLNSAYLCDAHSGMLVFMRARVRAVGCRSGLVPRPLLSRWHLCR